MNITCARLVGLRDYWLSLKGEKPFPSRNDMDPLDIPAILSSIALTDVFHSPLRFKYRLIGTGITDFAGRDATGKWLDEELYGDGLDAMLFSFRECVRLEEPVAVREHILFADKDWLVVEVLLLPMGDPDKPIDMVMSAVEQVADSVAKPQAGQRIKLDWRPS